MGGGLAGVVVEHSLVRNSFSTGIVSGENMIGGFIGYIWDDCSVEDSYWDIETSGLTESAAGEGRSTTEMTYPYAENTYVDWEFEEIWLADMDYEINDGYPYLLEIDYTTNEDDHLITPPDISISNYPNPFNPSTTINFAIPRSDNVKVAVFNIKGQQVDIILDDFVEAGQHTIAWNGTNSKGRRVSSGIYFTRLTSGNESRFLKMLLLK